MAGQLGQLPPGRCGNAVDTSRASGSLQAEWSTQRVVVRLNFFGPPLERRTRRGDSRHARDERGRDSGRHG